MKFSRLVLTAVIFTLGIAGFAVRTTPQTTTHIKTVWIILMENHNWSQIIGSKSAPYINSTLLPIASHAEQYFNPPGIHPSEPNYLWLEAGTNFGILDDNEPAVNHQSTTQHLATFLQNKNISWKSYQENIDGTTCLLVSSGLYATKHNPFVFFDDVTNNLNANSANCIAHIRHSRRSPAIWRQATSLSTISSRRICATTCMTSASRSTIPSSRATPGFRRTCRKF